MAGANARAKANWRTAGWAALVLLAMATALHGDLAHVRRADRIAQEGSPAPAKAPDSRTGYINEQRHFLGTAQRGETYRWIAAVQDSLADGFLTVTHAPADAAPGERVLLLPKLYTAWVAAVSGALQPFTGESLPLAVEHAARWEPLISHLLALLGAALFMGWRHGPWAAALTAGFFAVYPPLVSQFQPGALTADTWALLLAALAVALGGPGRRDDPAPLTLRGSSAVAAGLAIWLNPAFGFPAVLLTAAASAAAQIPVGGAAGRIVRWAGLGAGTVMIGWLINRLPWDPAASELRAIHPLYALAWLGVGLALVGWQQWRQGGAPRRAVWSLAVAPLLAAPLVVTQWRNGYGGWLQSTADLRRFASVDGAPIFNHGFDWLSQASGMELLLVLSPLLLVGITWTGARFGGGALTRPDRSVMFGAAVALGGAVALAGYHVRWSVVAALVAIAWTCQALNHATPAARRLILGLAAAFIFLFAAWGRSPSETFRPAVAATVPTAADLEAMVFRHFSHWLAAQTPGREIRVLAPPALADSIVYHADGGVLLSTAWESHPGHVAGSRILSSPEATEAEAVIESLGLTHLVITSWDQVFPLLVKEPLEADRDTLYARLQRWVLPPYLRPLPYRLPVTPGFAAEKLVVFAVVPPQDEALALSRLAEYFVEVGRPEPAQRVADSLAQAYPEDPNATMARALVHEATGRPDAFAAEVDRLAEGVAGGLVPADWDRRVVRAILLALGRRHDLARPEIAACNEAMTDESLRRLTPRQIFQLRKLLEIYGLEFPSVELAGLAQALSSDYRS